MPAFMTEKLVRSLYKHRRGDPGKDLARPIPPLTYSRELFGEGLSEFQERAELLIRMGVTTDQGPILVVGCGFGFLMEKLAKIGVADPDLMVGLEPGLYFRRNLESESDPAIRGRIFDTWIGDGQEHRLGGPFSWVIDEDAAPAHSDEELPAFMEKLEDLASTDPLPNPLPNRTRRRKARIIHLVTPLNVALGPGDSSQNWKTPHEWIQEAPTHQWIDLTTKESF